MKARPQTPEEVGPEWTEVLRRLPGYDPFLGTGGAWFEAAEAKKAIDFCRECIRHVEGDLAGQPFVLQPWEECIFANIFGWKRKDDKDRTVRRYREALVYVPRKNGKTPLAAALALYVFFCDPELGQQNYIAAAEREQAGMLFRHARGMVEGEPELKKRCRIYGGTAAAGQSKSIYRERDGSFIRVISADAKTKHGGNSHLIIVDELHAQPDRELVDVLRTSMASANRKQPLFISLTTADFDRPSICNEMHDYACRVRDGVFSDPSFLPAIYETSRDEDWTSEEVWAKANPNLGVSVSLEYIRAQCEKAKLVAALEFTFRRLHLNQRTGTETKAIDLGRWDGCARPIKLEDYEGRECFGGLDLSSTTDLTALALLFPEENNCFAAFVLLWAPREKAEARSKMDRVPYLLWAEEGWLILTQGDVVDYDRVRRDFNNLSERFFIRETAADRWNATQILTQLSGDGHEIVAFGQGYKSMTGPTKDLLARITAVTIIHDGNPVLRWMAGNLAVEVDAAENYKPSKKKSSDRIDGFTAIIMALGRALLYLESMFEKRGIEYLGDEEVALEEATKEEQGSEEKEPTFGFGYDADDDDEDDDQW